jgi:hypothetical protein
MSRDGLGRFDRLTTFLYVAAATALGILVNGYRFGIWDHATYVPMLERMGDPTLFPRDYLFNVPLADYAFWFPAIAMLIRLFPLQWVFFVGHVAAQFAFFLAIYHVSFAIFRSRGAAALAVLLSVVPKWVGGTTNFTHDMYFVPREVAIPVALAALIPLYRGRLVLAAAVAAAAFLLHPVTGVSVVALVLLSAVFDWKRFRRGTSAKAILVTLVCIAPLFFRVFHGNHAPVPKGGILERSAPDWLEILRRRSAGLFVSNWTAAETLSVIAYLTILIGSLLARRWYRTAKPAQGGDLNGGAPSPEPLGDVRRVDRTTWRAILVCAGLMACAVIFVEWYPLPAIIEVNLSRSLHLVVNLAMVYTSWMLWEVSRAIRRVLEAGGREYRYLGLLMGSVIPLLLVLLLMGSSVRLVILGTVPFLWWIAALGLSERSAAGTVDLASRVWIIGGIFVWAVALFFIHQFGLLGERGVFGPTTLAVVAIVVGVGELTGRGMGKRGSPLPLKLAGRSLLVAVAILFLFTNRAILVRTVTAPYFAERVAIPGKPLRTDWMFFGNLPYNDWIDVGRWCEANTLPNALFLVPPQTEGFRVYSHRGIVGDWTDGSISAFSRPFALDWWRRMGELDGYDSFDESRLRELSSKYGAAFAVKRRGQRLALPVAYENGGLVVYSFDSVRAHSDDGAPGNLRADARLKN